MRCALSRPTLIEKDNEISRRIGKLPILSHDAAARPAVQEHNRLAVRIAALLVINLVNVRDFEATGVKGFDRRIKGSQLCHNLRILLSFPDDRRQTMLVRNAWPGQSSIRTLPRRRLLSK